MIKTISKLALCLLMLGGSAKAWEYKDTNSNVAKINGSAEFYANYAGHVDYSTQLPSVHNHPLSTNGKFRLDLNVSHFFDQTLSVSGILRSDFQTDGVLAIRRAYLEVDSTHLGTLKLGRYQGFSNEVLSLSDVDLVMGTPSENGLNAYPGLDGSTINNLVYGGDPETGMEYSISFMNNSLMLVGNVGIMTDNNMFFVGVPGNTAVVGNSDHNNAYSQDTLSLRNKYRFGLGASYKLSLASGVDVTVAGNYNYLGVNSLVAYANGKLHTEDTSEHPGKNGISYGIAGIGMSYKTFQIGFTANTKMFSTGDTSVIYNKTAPSDVSGVSMLGSAKAVANGFEIGGKYGFANVYNADGSIAWSRMIAHAQFDYESLDKQAKLTDGYIAKRETIEATALELGMCYYVTPTFHYLAAVDLDLRDAADVRNADGLSKDANYSRHNLFSVGAVYKF